MYMLMYIAEVEAASHVRMMAMIRKQIYVEPEQEAWLKHLANETGLPEAAIIRQALERHRRLLSAPRRDPRVWQAERAFLHHLMRVGPIPGGRTWQRGDLYEC